MSSESTSRLPKEIGHLMAERTAGERLMSAVFTSARTALLETYPILNDPKYLNAIPSLENTHVVPIKTIEQIEREKIGANKSTLYIWLRSAGIPANELDDIYHTTDYEYPIFTWEEDGKTTTYVGDQLVDTLSRGGQTASQNALFLGIALIQEGIKAAAVSRPLPSQPEWREIARNGLSSLLKRLGQAGYDKGLLEGVEDAMEKKVDGNSWTTAKGAGVRLYIPGEAHSNPIFTAGNNFNTGLIQYLARDAKVALIRLMKEPLKISTEPKIPKHPHEETARLLLEDMKEEWFIPADQTQTIFDPKEDESDEQNAKSDKNKAKKNKKNANIDKQMLMGAYLESLIPVFYHASSVPEKKNKISPWVYPD